MLTERLKVPSEPKKRDFIPAKNPVDARREVVGMIFHAKKCVPGSIFCARTEFNTSFGNVVARAVHAKVQLRCQSWECAMKTSHNIDPRINIGSMR